MTANWVLVLQPPGVQTTRTIGGLSVPLRLALDAQAAGFVGIVDASGDPFVARALGDPRLRIPVTSTPPPQTRSIAVPAHWLVHRSTFSTLVDGQPADDRPLDMATMNLRCSAPWGFEPIPVVDATTAKQAERALWRSLRKAQDGWTSRWFNRYVSLRISRWLVKTPFSPNQISVAILAVGLSGAYLASRGTYLTLAAGAVLFQAQSILDGCDGEVSRITHRGSKAGEWFDTIGDDLTNYCFFAGAAIGLYRSTHQLLYVAAGAVTVLCGLLSSGLEYRYLIRIGSGDLLKYPLSQATTGEARGLARLAPLFKRDSFVFMTMLAALAGRVDVALVVFALGAIGITVAVLKTELRLAHPPMGKG
jgi:phosphatidylglycerophosphate synthase